MIEYSEEWLLPLVFKIEGSVYFRSALWSVPSACLTLVLVIYLRDYPEPLEEGIRRLDFDSLSKSHLWSALTVVLVFMVSFRTRQGLSRFWEGTGLLHQMKGEWFDTVSNCVTFTISAKEQDEDKVQCFRHTIVRLMSLCHASALEEISNMGAQMETIDVLGLNSATLRHLHECVETHKFNKVEVLLHLLQSLITSAQADGLIKVPPPILSRVYQTISRGYVNLLNTKKITDTKFPFPYVQLITVLLLAHTLFTPLVMAVSVNSVILAPLVAFIPLFGLHSMNFIAMELEDPFGMDDNDLPLNHFQAEMNNCLLMLLHPGTDIICGINPDRCVMDFEELKTSVCKANTLDSEGAMRSSFVSSTFLGGGWGRTEQRSTVKDKVPDTQKLFHPSFRIMDSTTSLDGTLGSVTVTDSAFGECYSTQEPTRSVSGQQSDESRMAQVASPAERSTQEEPRQQDVNWTDRILLPESLEPKVAMNQPRKEKLSELDGVLCKSMKELNASLHTWTRAMENQIQELSHRFSALNELAVAQPPAPQPPVAQPPAPQPQSRGGSPRRSGRGETAAAVAGSRADNGQCRGTPRDGPASDVRRDLSFSDVLSDDGKGEAASDTRAQRRKEMATEVTHLAPAGSLTAGTLPPACTCNATI